MYNYSQNRSTNLSSTRQNATDCIIMKRATSLRTSRLVKTNSTNVGWWRLCVVVVTIMMSTTLPQVSLALSSSPSSVNSGTPPTTTTIRQGQQQQQDCIYDMPVSNNGARCRIILYKKGLLDPNNKNNNDNDNDNDPISRVTILSPMDIGGLRSEEYLKVNPQSKMPAMVCGGGGDGLALGESDTIARYLLTKYAHDGPSFQVDDPKSNYLARIHDMYLTTIQGCMYKAVGPFGTFWTRKDALAEYVRQWNIIENTIVEDTTDAAPFLCGTQVSLADATIFPSAVFAAFMLPKFDIHPALPPKLDAWFQRLRTQDASFRAVYEEIQGALQGWEAKGRWDTILGAGLRDQEPATIFDKIIAGEIPATIVKEDDKILAFTDINPAAPAHVLVIPKDRNGLSRLTKSSAEHIEILGRLMVAAGEIARDASLGCGDGARMVINDGPDGGQEIPHLHVSVLFFFLLDLIPQCVWFATYSHLSVPLNHHTTSTY